jgi:hypothetical protein
LFGRKKIWKAEMYDTYYTLFACMCTGRKNV